MEAIPMSYVAIFGGGFMGMLAHFLKLKIRKQSFKGVLKYFGSHFRDTLLAVMSTIGTCVLLLNTLPPETALSGLFVAGALGGFTSDSFWNTGGEQVGNAIV